MLEIWHVVLLINFPYKLHLKPLEFIFITASIILGSSKIQWKIPSEFSTYFHLVWEKTIKRSFRILKFKYKISTILTINKTFFFNLIIVMKWLFIELLRKIAINLAINFFLFIKYLNTVIINFTQPPLDGRYIKKNMILNLKHLDNKK